MSETGHPNSLVNTEAIAAHLQIIQGIVSRMAHNSAICKTWCVTLVAAIMVLVAQTETPAFALIALLPTLLFLILDTYYLMLERSFRNLYDQLVWKIQNNDYGIQDLYTARRPSMSRREKLAVVKSYAIWPFYLALFLTVWLMFGLAVLYSCHW